MFCEKQSVDNLSLRGVEAFNLKGKSFFRTTSDSFTYFSGEIAQETTTEIPEKLKESIKVFEEK
ncbi:hypothetical protein [Capnocytophaga canimorsus]|uniref:hypothetical protein n=1 Tax=Capnocytophaga canimorsus TaxID=28188 RepID=UPI0005A8AF41|nr:hypothetical protein [Capnocytophaga canimorsus]